MLARALVLILTIAASACSRPPGAAPPKVSAAPACGRAPLPADLQDVTFEGREDVSLSAVCDAWKADVLAVAKNMQKAGQGLDGYDAAGVTCTSVVAPRLEGDLPLGWSLLSAVVLRYFDGVTERDDRYVVLRRPDGRTIAGPMYSTSNDVGDSPVPSAWRLAMATARATPVLLVASVAVWRSPYDPSAGGDALVAELRGRVCRFEVARFTCDQARPTLFAKRTLDEAHAAAFRAAPTAELPAIDPATGTLRPAPE
jgi:hypothetical protein